MWHICWLLLFTPDSANCHNTVRDTQTTWLLLNAIFSNQIKFRSRGEENLMLQQLQAWKGGGKKNRKKKPIADFV